MPDAAQVERADRIRGGGGNAATLQTFVAHYEKKYPGAAHTAEVWSGHYDWWLDGRPVALRAAASRAVRASTPKPKRGAAPVPPLALTFDSAATQRLLHALPDYSADIAEGTPLNVCVARDINEPSIVSAITSALGVDALTDEIRDEALAALAGHLAA